MLHTAAFFFSFLPYGTVHERRPGPLSLHWIWMEAHMDYSTMDVAWRMRMRHGACASTTTCYGKVCE